ncbi:MAG: glycosyltransferase family 2 protein [Eubacteriales bacterium]|jgi:glycosyltransferase involved in cell wall biosynthesis
MTNKPFISACMMVKDEAANLQRCLSSLTGLVDEIIVVDTGSTDETVKIAESFNAKVYHHPWANDFSKHRNQSILYANGEWILIVDADEEVICPDQPLFKKLIKTLPEKYSSVAVGFNDIQAGKVIMKFNTTRFFRNGQVFYKGIVHNQPVQFGQTVFINDLTLNHYGYDLTPEQKQIKFERTKGLLYKRLKNNAKDYPVYFYLSQLFGTMGNAEKCVEYAEKYVSLKKEMPKEVFNKSIYFTLICNLMKKIKDPVKTNRYLKEGLEDLPGDLDLTMATIEYGVWINNDALIIDSSSEFLELYAEYEKDGAKKEQRFVYSHRPEALAYCYFHRTVASFRQGAKGMNGLFNTLEKIPCEAFKAGTITDLQIALAKCGIPISIKPKHLIEKEIVEA